MGFNKKTLDFLVDSKLFASCSRIDLSRIAPHIRQVNLKSGDVLYSTEKDAEYLYLVINGKIELQSGKRVLSCLSEGSVGEEAIRKGAKYLTTAVAREDSSVIAIPRDKMADLFENYPGMKDSIYSSLVNHHAFVKMGNDAFISGEGKKKEGGDGIVDIVGWFLTILIPALIFFTGDITGFAWKSRIFMTVASATVLMWIFRLAHEFIPSILAVLVILILDIAPASVALSGFTSGSFFMAMSIFGISAVLVSSGLTYRLVINLLRIMPLSQFWHSFAIFVTGIFLTPLLPSANGRVSLASPILTDMVESLGYRKGGKASTRLAVATFAGFTMFSSIFLSSKAIHFIVFGLLPSQVREQFSWSYWFYGASVAGLVLLVLYLISTQIIFRNDEKPVLSRDIINAQHKVLGPLRRQEWAALGGIILFAAGIATSSIHKIQLPWVGLTVLYIVLAFGYLSKSDFRINIDWTFLVYLGTLLGLVRSMSYIGLDQQLGQHLLWLGEYTRSNFSLFVLLLSASIIGLRIFIPNNATVAILATVLFPIAALSGVNPWVVGFIILIMSDAWFMPYQCTYYILFDDLTSSRRLFDKKLMLKFNLVSISFRLIAVYASIPFWRMIGIL